MNTLPGHSLILTDMYTLPHNQDNRKFSSLTQTSLLLLCSQQFGTVGLDHAAADDTRGHQHRHQDGQDDQAQHGVLAFLDTGIVAHMADTCFLRVFQTISALK